MSFGGTIVIHTGDCQERALRALERKVIRRSLSTAEDGRLIVVNFGRNGHRARVTQWLDDQNVKYWVVV